MGFDLVLFHQTGSVVMTSLPAPGYGYSTTAAIRVFVVIPLMNNKLGNFTRKIYG